MAIYKWKTRIDNSGGEFLGNISITDWTFTIPTWCNFIIWNISNCPRYNYWWRADFMLNRQKTTSNHSFWQTWLWQWNENLTLTANFEDMTLTISGWSNWWTAYFYK
jgi:hypothetical protein